MIFFGADLFCYWPSGRGKCWPLSFFCWPSGGGVVVGFFYPGARLRAGGNAGIDFIGLLETRLAPGLLSVRYKHGNLATPPDTGAHFPLLPDDVTTVFPAMQARAVVYIISPLVEYTVPVLVLVILLAYHSDGSHVPPSSSLPLLSNNPCWCHRTYTISLTYVRCTTSPYVRTSVLVLAKGSYRPF